MPVGWIWWKLKMWVTLFSDVPKERLGAHGRIADVRRAKWFETFDFGALRARTLPAPYVPKVSKFYLVSHLYY